MIGEQDVREARSLIGPGPLAFSFGVLFGLVAIVARAVSVTAAEPWFSPAATVQVYSAALVGSAGAAAGIVYIAVKRSSHIGRADGKLPFRGGSESPGAETGRAGAHDDNLEPDAGPRGPGDVPPIPGSSSMGYAGAETPREVRRESRPGANLRRRVWATIAGPLILSLAIATVSSVMLPGSEGFAQANFRLNATFILMIAYGWWLVLAYSLTSVLLLPTRPAAGAPGRDTGGFRSGM